MPDDFQDEFGGGDIDTEELPQFQPEPYAETAVAPLRHPTGPIGGVDRFNARLEHQAVRAIHAQRQAANFAYDAEPFLPQEDLGINPIYAPQSVKTFTSNALPVTDRDIYANAPQIYKSLLDGANGDLNPQTFYDNPHWDRVRATGVPEEGIRALQASTLKAIQPLYKAGQFEKDAQIVEADPIAASFLKPFGAEMYRKPGSQHSYSLLHAAYQKAQLIRDDPDMSDAFQELIQSDKEDDKRTVAQLYQTPSASSANRIMAGWIKKQERVTAGREALKNDLGTRMTGMEGDTADAVKTAMEGLIDQGKFDGRMYGQFGKAFHQLLNADPQKGAMVLGAQLPSLRNDALEVKINRRISDLVAAGASTSDLFVGTNGQVYNKTQMENFTNQEVKAQFGDTRIKTKTPGEYVALPVKKFVDYAGNEVFPAIPTVDGQGNQIQAPAAYKHGEVMYVNRGWLKKVGVDQNQLESDEPIELGRGMVRWTANEVPDFQPHAMSADAFMSADPGQRLLADRAWYSAVNRLQTFQQSRSKEGIAVEPDPWNPSYMGEMTNAFKKSILSAGLSIGLGSAAAANSIRNLVMAGYHGALGNSDQAQEYFDAAKGKEEQGTDSLNAQLGSFPKLRERLHEAIETMSAEPEKFLLSPHGINANPNATTGMKVAAFGTGLVGDIAGMSVQLSLGPEMAGTTIANLLSKYSRIEKALQVAKALPYADQAMLDATLRQEHFLNLIRQPIAFAALGLEKGESDLSDIAHNALVGGIMAKVQNVGRGFRIPFTKGETLEASLGPKYGPKGELIVPKDMPVVDTITGTTLPWYADKLRLKAAAASAAGFYGLDAMNQMLHGKTPGEILDQLKDPEYVANLLTLPFFAAMGQRDIRVAPRASEAGGKPVEGAPKAPEVPPAEAKPEAPVAGIGEAMADDPLEQYPAMKVATANDLASRVEAAMTGQHPVPEDEFRAAVKASETPITDPQVPDEIRDVVNKSKEAAKEMAPKVKDLVKPVAQEYESMRESQAKGDVEGVKDAENAIIQLVPDPEVRKAVVMEVAKKAVEEGEVPKPIGIETIAPYEKELKHRLELNDAMHEQNREMMEKSPSAFIQEERTRVSQKKDILKELEQLPRKIEDLKNSTRSQVEALYNEGRITDSLFNEYVKLWNKTPRFGGGMKSIPISKLTPPPLISHLDVDPRFIKDNEVAGMLKDIGYGEAQIKEAAPKLQEAIERVQTEAKDNAEARDAAKLKSELEDQARDGGCL